MDVFEGPRRRELRWRSGADGFAEWYVQQKKRRGWKYGWALALLEMLVDPVLMEWVPAWVREQFHRWNPDFERSLVQVLCEDGSRSLCNREVLVATRRAVHALHLKRMSRKEQREAAARAADLEGDGGGSDGSASLAAASVGSASEGDENTDPVSAVRKTWHTEEEPVLADGEGNAADIGDRWEGMTAEERLSSAPPAPAASDCVRGALPVGLGGHVHDRLLGSPGFEWHRGNI